MPFFKTDDLASWTGGRWINLDASRRPDIHGFSNDSRKMQRDFAFVALPAERDGADFAQNAVENGAVAVIAQREIENLSVPLLLVDDALKAFQTIAHMHRLRFDSPVVAITGSCGKTSTKEALAKLTAWRNPVFTEGNFNNEIGVPLTLTRIDMRLNQLAIVEAGVSAPNQMENLAKMIEPDITVITNVGLSHLEGFGDIAGVAREKAVLPENGSQGSWCVMGEDLLNWSSFAQLRCRKAVVARTENPQQIKSDLVFRYSFTRAAECVGIDLKIEGGDEFYFEVAPATEGELSDTVLAIAAALMLGSREEFIASALDKIKPLPMRGSVTEWNNAKFYVDCYNASPTSMRDALDFFKTLSQDTPRTYVIGDMAELGLACVRLHREIAGSIEFRECDRIILVGKNADLYKEGLIAANWKPENITVVGTAEEAKPLLENAQGFIFVKGSRICALEKSLPDAVAEKLLSPAKPDDEPEIEESAPEESEPAETDDKSIGDDEDAEEFPEEDAESQEENFDGDDEDAPEDENAVKPLSEEDERDTI